MSRCRFKNYAIALALGGWVAIWAHVGWADPAAGRTFDGPDTVWKLFDIGVPSQILAQECVPGGARDNQGFERVVVAAPAGQSALLVCGIPSVAVLDELQIRMWVKASRPDVQLAARVTLPRSLDLQRRAPAIAIVKGAIYNRPGHWQELQIAAVPRLLADQIRVMRATPGAAIDAHEAFVDAVVLLVPGNGSGMEVGTDDLEVDGVLLSAKAAVHPAGKQPGSATPGAFSQRREITGRQAAVGTPERAPSAAEKSTVRVQGTTLLVDDKLFLPRVIQWRGEPLPFLADCGFNVVQLPAPPTPEQSAEAERLGLWFLCSPEHPEALARTELGSVGDRVLAWHLQDAALEVDPNYAIRWAELVRERDAVYGRPVVISPDSNGTPTCKAADILIARQSRTGLMSEPEFDHWLETCPENFPPGMPLWIGIPTQFDETLCRQVNALTRQGAAPLSIDGPQLESFVRLACAHGVRGFFFQSTSSLSATDKVTRQRAATLQLINRRLQLIEPWLAGGKMIHRTSSSDGAQTGILLHVDRARLLVRLANDNSAPVRGISTGKSSSNEIVFTVPGVPESSQVFYLSPAAMRILPAQRIAGGTKLLLPARGDGFVLMTEDPRVIQSLAQRVARDGAKTIQLERELAKQRARMLADTGQRLAQLGYNSDSASRAAASVNQQLAQLDSLITSGQIEQSHDLAAAVMQNLERAQVEQRRAAVATAGLESNPLAASFGTLAAFAAFQRTAQSMRPGGNLLVGGDFEDLVQMTQLGWQHVTSQVPNVETSAQLSSVEPQHGTYCLELNTIRAPTQQQQDHSGNLVWIVSPPMAIAENAIVEITGWVRVDKQFPVGSGVEIVDSLGGPTLSLLVGQTSGWRPFRMIRAASEPTQLRLTFSLSGLGSAKVDAVMVRLLEQPNPTRLPAVPPANPSTATSAAAPTGSGLTTPQTR